MQLEVKNTSARSPAHHSESGSCFYPAWKTGYLRSTRRVLAGLSGRNPKVPPGPRPRRVPPPMPRETRRRWPWLCRLGWSLGRGKIKTNLWNKKAQNQLCWLTTHKGDNNKIYTHTKKRGQSLLLHSILSLQRTGVKKVQFYKLYHII